MPTFMKQPTSLIFITTLMPFVSATKLRNIFLTIQKIQFTFDSHFIG